MIIKSTSQEEEIRRHGLLLFRQALKGWCSHCESYKRGRLEEHCPALAVSACDRRTDRNI
jgi:hypothetical protein